MNEIKQTSFPLSRCFSLDRNDIYANDISAYPGSYEDFKAAIENAFFKSELLLKCKMEFERLKKMEILEPKHDTDVSSDDISLNLIFTGNIKSGRSSVINMILNSKVMPVNILGNTCCVKITHPKSNLKQISVGTYDWDGWELDKINDIDFEELPKKIEEMQQKLLRNSFSKGKKMSRRLHVQLPHWFLKNINIYKCSPIDGIYSFDEPFDLIEKSKNPILMHVIDASNGLMEWDRTFLAKIQYKNPQLPIFFMINHVDIQYEILLRDRCLPFGLTPDKGKNDLFESESDQTSTDDTGSEQYVFNEANIILQQNNLIEKSKKQIEKLGFALEKNLTVYYSSFSVKEFFKFISNTDFHWNMVTIFFEKLNTFLSVWMEKVLITSSLQLKCQINGVVDAILCQILYPNVLSKDISSDIYIQNIKKAERTITEAFASVGTNVEKNLLKVVKEQLKKHETKLFETIPDLSTDDPSEIIHIIKPNLIKNCEHILIGKQSQFNINDKIDEIIKKEFDCWEKTFQKVSRAKGMINFTKYVFNLFRVLKKTFNHPLIINIPEEIFYGNSKWYKDIIRVASRKFRGSICKPRELVLQMINDLTVMPLFKTTQMGIDDILRDIQFFTRKYQEAYKNAGSWPAESQDVFRKLVMVDFIIKAIEKSFQNKHLRSYATNLIKLQSFYSDFYIRNEDDKYMHKNINIQSFTSLFVAIGDLCFKRICQQNQFVLSHKSTELLQNGMCLISYRKMDCDLYTAIENKTKWSQNSVQYIMRHLTKAIQCLLPYCYYIQINLLPENILLKKNLSGIYNVFVFPFTEINTSLNYNPRSDPHRKYDKVITAIIFQLGMVLSWIITNDLQICSEIYNQQNSSELEKIVVNKIKVNVISDLQYSSFHKICGKYLFHPEDYDSIDMVMREWPKNLSEVDGLWEIREQSSSLTT